MENKDFFKNIKAVGFDFDDTLVDEQYSIRKRWEKVLPQFSFLSPDLEKTFFKVYRQKGPAYKFHVDDTLRQLKIDQENTEKIVGKFLETRGDELLLEGALEILELLKSKGFKIGIITDGKQSYQQDRIKKAGIFDFLDFVYYGNGKKEKKPDKKVEIESPEQFFYVGNDFANDIEGMLAFKSKVCWVTKEKNIPEISGAIKVESLKELLKYF